MTISHPFYSISTGWGVRERIVFKVLLMVYKILNDLAPAYLCALVGRYVPGRSSLRSANPDPFLLKRTDPKSTTKTYGWRAFSVYAPFLWNNLPMLLRQSENVNIFKRNLKSHLFRKQFDV